MKEKILCAITCVTAFVLGYGITDPGGDAWWYLVKYMIRKIVESV